MNWFMRKKNCLVRIFLNYAANVPTDSDSDYMKYIKKKLNEKN